MTTETTRLNDVNLVAVGDLIAAIEEDPTKADTVWGATVQWKGGFSSEVKVREHAVFLSDEPEALGGGDVAPNPVEQLLGALGNCLAVGYAANATLAGIELKDLRIDLEGELDLRAFLGLVEGHAGYEHIRARVHLESDAEDAEIVELHRKVLGSSPVGHTLSTPISLDVSLA